MDGKTILYESCAKMGVLLTEKQLEQFLQYQKLLLEWNEKMNLTAITEEREVMLKHFADCISIVSAVSLPKNASVIDVGTGAGFPGIPLKVVCPCLHMTLLDSLQKRIVFLEEVIKKLSLEHISCVHARAEDGGKNEYYREQFDYCVSRAVANLTVLSEYCLPFVKLGGLLIALKGPEAEQEVNQAKRAIQVLGGEVIEIKQIIIPDTELRHTLVLIKKVIQTPSQYPRKAGKVLKNPII